MKVSSMLMEKFIFRDADEHDFTIWVTSTAVFIVFWIASFTFLIIDLTGSLKKYKIQPGRNEPLDTTKLVGVIEYYQCRSQT